MKASAAQVDFVVPSFGPHPGSAKWAAQCFKECEKQLHADLRLIWVDDGSPDSSAWAAERDQLKSLLGDRLVFVRLNENQGKGAAVREGFRHARPGAFVVMTDCDFPYGTELIVNALKQALNQSQDVVVGSRPARYYTQIPWQRRVISLVFRAWVRLGLGLPIHDTQCGLKVFSPDAVELGKNLFTDTYLFDVELLLRARRQRLKIASIDALPLKGFKQSAMKWKVLAREGVSLLRLIGSGLLPLRTTLAGCGALSLGLFFFVKNLSMN